MRLSERIRYSLFAMPLAMAALPIYVFVPKLYAEMGLSLAALGSLLLIMRFFDACIDPFLGNLADVMPTQYRRKAAIAFASVSLSVGILILLNPKATEQLWLHLIGSLILVTLGFSLASIAYNAWGVETTPDSRVQTQLIAGREAAGLIGVLVASALPTFLAANAMSTLASLQVGLLVLTLLLLCTLNEQAQQAMSPTDTGLSSWRQLLNDRSFLALLLVFAINGIASAIPATLLLFYVSDVLQAKDWESYFLLAYFIAGALFLPIWGALAHRLGKVNTWLIAMALAISVFVLTSSLGKGDKWPFILICMTSGLALGADLVIPSALLTEMIQKQKAQAMSGRYFGWWTSVTKANLGLAAGLALPALSVLGYRSNDSSSNLSALVFTYALLPCLLKLLAMALLWHFRHLIAPKESI